MANDAEHHLGDLTDVADNIAPVLDTQTDTSDAVSAWASHLANITQQLQSNDRSVQSVLSDGPAAAAKTKQLLERLQPTLPVLLANLTSINRS